MTASFCDASAANAESTPVELDFARQMNCDLPPTELAKRKPWDEGAPRFGGARAFGATPNREFRHLVPLCGARDGLVFSVAKGALPEGVSLDARTGVLSGRCARAGRYDFTVCATNAEGRAERDIVLLIGDDKRGQCPMMGWTSWNAHTYYVSQERVLRAARAMVAKGLAARGYEYVNIDSCWQGARDVYPDKSLAANARFPDMKGLVDEVHGLGLKAGIYSSPMTIAWGTTEKLTCRGSTGDPVDEAFKCGFAGCGKTRYEPVDAARWATWGFDFLKYDWPLCDMPHTEAMRTALDATDRDFVLLITTSGKFKHVNDYPKCAQMVRSGEDTFGTWRSMLNLKMVADKWLPFVRPGFWYDLDMTAIGPMSMNDRSADPGDPPAKPAARLLSKFSRDEMISQFALWAVLPSPLILSFEIDWADEDLLDLVSNEDLIAINQDWPCRPSVVTDVDDDLRRYERLLSDGSKAILYINYGDEAKKVDEPLETAGCVRDVLAGRALGEKNALRFVLRPHATRVFRVGGPSIRKDR